MFFLYSCPELVLDLWDLSVWYEISCVLSCQFNGLTLSKCSTLYNSGITRKRAHFNWQRM
jgi:hypothetical protein